VSTINVMVPFELHKPNTTI